MLSLPSADLLQIQSYTTMIDNPGPGGAAVVWRRGNDTGSWSGGEPDSTIIRLTMRALIEGLTRAPAASRVEVLTATKYLVNAFDQGWVTTWRENGWRRPKRGVIANVDLWERLLDAVDGRDAPIRWLHGKPFSEEGRRCQRLARVAATEAGK